MRYWLIAVLFLALQACVNSIDEVERVTGLYDVEAEVGTDVEILYTEFGRPNVKISGPLMLRYESEDDPRVEFPDGVQVDIYDAEGNADSRLTAKNGVAKEGGEEVMYAKDDVVVVNNKGERLETEELIWDQKARKIYSETFVKITTEDEILMGEGMESDENFTNYTIKKITGIIKVDENALGEDS